MDTPRRTHHVLLIPGFFGFGKLGEISYFTGVREAIEANFSALGLAVTVTEVPTLPMASIRLRAARVRDTLAAVARLADGPIHLIGHSTGGLDARLAIAPTASLPGAVAFDAYERVQTLVTVCTPHYGTPVATYFTRPLGRFLIRTLGSYSIFMLGRGRLPLKLLLRLGYFVVRVRDPLRKRRNAFDYLYEKLLTDLSEARRLELATFLRAVVDDQSLLFQLTPAGCDLLNACTADPKVAYASVVARAAPPSFRNAWRSLWDLYTQLMFPVYACLHRIARRGELGNPALTPLQQLQLAQNEATVPVRTDSDGLVPTLSQVWGPVLYFAQADHLDVVGQYGLPGQPAATGDWIPSYSPFGREQFLELWSTVTRFISGVAADRSSSHDVHENAP
ncbi:MAG: triacylglycerol lipase [Polyangiaceae bacterium]